MKAISVKQPWGSLICSGAKDVENRTWALKSTPMRLLIHTGAKRDAGCGEADMPDCWRAIIDNAQDIGALGRLGDTPVSAIIGVATVVRCVNDSPSVWANYGCWHWEIRDARMLKRPLLGVKGKLGIFDVPGITEGQLPELADTPKIERSGKHLRIPLCPRLYERLAKGETDTFVHNLVMQNLDVFATPGLAPLPTESVTFWCAGGGRPEISAPVKDCRIYPLLDENGERIEYEDDFGETYQWWKVAVTI